MELVLCIGIPATGKSTFCRERFYDTHLRINLDMLRTRHRERLLVAACIEAKQRFVVDNNNLTREERAAYIVPAKAARFGVSGYFFQSRVHDALERNRLRPEPARLPDKAVRGQNGRLELPALAEGFDCLHFVRLLDAGGFLVEDWQPPSP